MATGERLRPIGQIASRTRDAGMSADRSAAVTATSARKLAIAAGVCYLITHVTSVGAPALYGPVLNNARFVAGSGPDTSVLVGALFEVILALAIVGTPVALYPVVRGRVCSLMAPA